jgi:hypothetical protein
MLQMSIEELKAELQSLVSERVTFKRNTSNSLIIYFHGEPGDSEVRSLFIDPTWRFEHNGRILIGSFDFQIEESDFGSEEEYESEWRRRCELMASLVGSELLTVEIEDSSLDLTLEFSDRQIVRSFANSAFDEESWTYRNVPKKLKATVSPLGVRIVELQEKPAQASGDK